MKKAVFYKATKDGQKVVGTIDEEGKTTGIGKNIKNDGYTFMKKTIEWGDENFFNIIPWAFDGRYLRGGVEENGKQLDPRKLYEPPKEWFG